MKNTQMRHEARRAARIRAQAWPTPTSPVRRTDSDDVIMGVALSTLYSNSSSSSSSSDSSSSSSSSSSDSGGGGGE